MSKFTVAIVGAGLGGLIQAIALETFAPDVEVQIYEGASQLSEVGAGIGMHQRVWDIMPMLGLDATLSAVRPDDTDESGSLMRYRKADQPVGYTFHDLKQGRVRMFHRSELQTAFAKHVKAKIHLSKRLVEYVDPEDETKPVVLHFQDGSVFTCDLVIGADGIRSTCRKTMYAVLAAGAESEERASELRSHIDPVWSGVISYRTMVPSEVVIEKNGGAVHATMKDPIIYVGVNRSLMAFSVANGRVYIGVNIVHAQQDPDAMYDGPWVAAVDADEVAKEFEGYENEVKVLLECPSKLQAWAVHRVKPLPAFVHGRVALLGDAAHAMVQFQGSGAGQAFEDGFVLAHLLAHPKVTRGNLTAALRVYDAVRRPFSQNVAQLSLHSARLANLQAGPCEGLTAEASRTGEAVSEAQLREVGAAIQDAFGWLDATTIVEDTAQAVARLEHSLGVPRG